MIGNCFLKIMTVRPANWGGEEKSTEHGSVYSLYRRDLPASKNVITTKSILEQYPETNPE